MLLELDGMQSSAPPGTLFASLFCRRCRIFSRPPSWHLACVLISQLSRSAPLPYSALTPSTPSLSIPSPAVPKGLTAAGGIDCLVHAIESYVSIFATDYTKASLGCGKPGMWEE